MMDELDYRVKEAIIMIPRLLIIGHDPLARAGLVGMLSPLSQFQVMGQLSPASSSEIPLFLPDVVIADFGWEPNNDDDSWALGQQSVAVLGLIRDVVDAPTVLPTLQRLAHRRGYGLLLRSSPIEQLAPSITAVLGGVMVFAPEIMQGNLFPPSQHTTPNNLTERESEVLTRVAQGLTNKAVAHQLGISEYTVKFHLNAIMTKLNVASRTEAVVQATRLGWLRL